VLQELCELPLSLSFPLMPNFSYVLFVQNMHHNVS
jgi:hypothetical protein